MVIFYKLKTFNPFEMVKSEKRINQNKSVREELLK